MSFKREFTRAVFTSETLEKVIFDGFSDGTSWNGWACPYFELEAAKNVLKESERNGYRWSYSEDLDRFLVKHVEDPEDYNPEIFEAVDIAVNGQNITVYAIGAYSWTWVML